MSPRKTSVLMLLSLFGLFGCGPERTFPPPAPAPDRDWAMRLIQTGGLAGVHLEIQVTSAGELMAEDQRTGRIASQGLSPRELTDLDTLLQRLEPQQDARVPSSCADCFVYDLEITSGTGISRVRVDDTTLPASGAQALIEYLRELRDKALSTVS